ncbi:unnamed protein product [Clonostachys rosea]|uniref:Uncharacterized protein n=1 Tax=Bionectria ochroleuca TaxID=29856 RepID=A0ABY6UN66_BIOOC|nr:unnamed protein product [Clonostachys rosea]
MKLHLSYGRVEVVKSTFGGSSRDIDDLAFTNMLDAHDTRAQPWKTWYAALHKDASSGGSGGSSGGSGGGAVTQGNNGNDNFDRHIFGTCSPATTAAKEHFASQNAGMGN